MTVETPGTSQRPWALLAAVIAALALSGCATTHVGEDWQCPLAQGTQCTSVAAADPAVPPADLAARGAEERPTVPEAEDRSGASRRECAAGCNPFAIFARLIPGGPSDGPADSNPADGESEEDVPSVDSTGGASGDDGIEAPITPGAGPEPAREEGTADAPVATSDPQVPLSLPGTPLPNRELRVPETVGRVWIAPYVDAGGVYREAAWVRIVIAPARWRLP